MCWRLLSLKLILKLNPISKAVKFKNERQTAELKYRKNRDFDKSLMNWISLDVNRALDSDVICCSITQMLHCMMKSAYTQLSTDIILLNSRNNRREKKTVLKTRYEGGFEVYCTYI